MSDIQLTPSNSAQATARQHRINSIIEETVHRQQRRQSWTRAMLVPLTVSMSLMVSVFSLVNLSDAFYVSAMAFKPAAPLIELLRLNDNFEPLFIQGIAQPVEIQLTSEGVTLIAHHVAVDGLETIVFLTVKGRNGESLPAGTWMNRLNLVDSSGNTFPCFTVEETPSLSAATFHTTDVEGDLILTFNGAEALIELDSSAIVPSKTILEEVEIKTQGSTILLHRVEVGVVKTRIVYSILNGDSTRIVLHPAFRFGNQVSHGLLLGTATDQQVELWLDVGQWDRIETEALILESVEVLQAQDQRITLDVVNQTLINLPEDITMDKVEIHTNEQGQAELVITLSSQTIAPTYFEHHSLVRQSAEQGTDGRWVSRLIISDVNSLTDNLELVLRSGQLITLNQKIPTNP